MSAQARIPGTALLAAIQRLRPLPDVAQRVLQLVQDPEQSVDDLLAIVRTDGTLVARVMRFANSAGCAVRSEIKSLGDAVSFLGSRHLVQLVLATCSAPTFAQASSSTWVDPDHVWRHSLATAFASERLAATIAPTCRATAFTAGVLHGLGALALAACTGPEHAEAFAATDADLPTQERERAAFGIDHALAAGLVAAGWRLPHELVATLRDHHNAPTGTSEANLSRLLRSGEAIADQLLTEPPLADSAAATTVGTRLHIEESQIAAALADAKAGLAACAELLNLAGPVRR